MPHSTIQRITRAVRGSSATRGSGLDITVKRAAHSFVEECLGILFPELNCRHDQESRRNNTDKRKIAAKLKRLVRPFLSNAGDDPDVIAASAADEILALREALLSDASAIFAGDPAAESLEEVILAYPGFTAIAIHRIAHVLYAKNIPILPRLISEYGHQLTGIDIHPGARIGWSFAIDHGTGIVIGESAVIGDHVKIYQGVTLGALSVRKELAKSKRHPTIGDHVVIYAQAVILGGETIVGHHSIVGGNVWLTHSVPPHSVIRQQSETVEQIVSHSPSALDYTI